MSRRIWSPDDVRALGVATDVVTAGSIFGMGRTLARELVRRGDFPVAAIRVGVKIVVPTAPILRLLEVDPGDGEGEARTAPPVANLARSAATTPPVVLGTTEVTHAR